MKTIKYIFNFQTCMFILPALLIFSRAVADITVVIISICFISHSISNRDWRWLKKPWILTALTLWGVSVLIVSPLAIDPGTSVVHASRFVRFIIFGAALAYWILDDKNKMRLFQKGMIVAVIFIACDTFLQFITGEDIFGRQIPRPNRLTGPFSDDVVGTILARISFISLAAIWFCSKFESTSKKFLITSISISIMFCCIFITGERGAFLIYSMCSTILLLMFFFTHKKYRAMIGSLVTIIIILVAGIAMTNPKIKSRMIDSTVTYISNYPNSANGRIVSSAFEIWSKHGNYFTGIGIRNYRSQIATADNEKLRKKYKLNPNNARHTHNIYIEWLIEAGVIGLIGFSLMVCLILKEIFSATLPQRQYIAATFAFAVLLTTFFPFMGGMSFFTNHIACIIWMTVGWSIAFTSKKSCLERHV